MKLKIMGYDVSIKCKKWYEYEGYTEKTTMHFLNELSIILKESGEWNKEHGYDDLGDIYFKYGHEIYELLKNKGFYEKGSK